MKESPKRILLKLSGEALGENGRLFDQDMILRVGKILSDVAATGVQLGVVIGAGNIWRGRQSKEMDAVTADHMGMLGTVINCLCMRDAVERTGRPCRGVLRHRYAPRVRALQCAVRAPGHG